MEEPFLLRHNKPLLSLLLACPWWVKQDYVEDDVFDKDAAQDDDGVDVNAEEGGEGNDDDTTACRQPP